MLINASVGPVIPIASSFAKSILWLIESKALERSINKAPANLPQSMALLISSVKEISARSVEKPALKPN